MAEDHSTRFSFKNYIRPHGVGVRGIDAPRSEQFEGRFGRMFRTLPPADHNSDDLVKLAQAMVAVREEEETSEDELDSEENRGIAAGYTYWGQFIDHDITFDPNSSLQKANDPNGLVDFRTPRFDLDCVYGRGPDDQPYLYESDGIRLRLGRELTGNASDAGTRDLPRDERKVGDKRALIGDPRNDENVIVSQLQGIFLRLHNRIADLYPDANFAEVQRLVRWHYQWAVLHDFLPTIVGDEMVFKVLPSLKRDTSIYEDKPNFRFFHWRYNPFMPVEFSVAAYRFGHSMIRPEYRLSRGLAPRFPIFSMTEKDLRGFGEFPDNWAIEWDLFFHIHAGSGNTGKNRVQPSYKIDTSLVEPLGNLPFIKDIPSLAERNLKRGVSMGLPSGQTVARHMCEEVIDEDDLRVGKLTEDDNDDNPTLVSISENFRDNAPLWYYILAETRSQFKDDDTAIRLGPVGGRIVAEVIGGLILGDNHSYLAQQPCWRPCFERKGEFGMAELILVATGKLG
jgi:hypothetical protein